VKETPDMDSEVAQVAIVTVLSILVIIDIIGNSFVCIIITRNPDMRFERARH